MRRPRFGLVSRSPGGPGQPSAGIRTGRPMSGRRRRSGGHRSGSRSHWGDLSPPGSAAQGDRKRRLNSPDCFKLVRVWSAGRRLPPIARRKETPSHGVSGGFASRSGSLARSRVCRRSAPLEGERDVKCHEGLPEADTKIRAMAHASSSFRGAPKARTRNPETSMEQASGFRVRPLTGPPRNDDAV
jgi:hypothetical protein